jgi:hypothetical protein
VIRLALVLLVCLLPSAGAAAPVSFERLRHGDTLWVSYESRGCFSGLHVELAFFGDKPDTAHMQLWYLGIGQHSEEPQVLAVAVTPMQRRGLDTLMVCYKTMPMEISSGSSRLTLTSSRKGRRTTVLDRTNLSTLPPGVLRLEDLIPDR